MTPSGSSYGTVTHSALEVLQEGAFSKASDAYSFGVLLHEMITGALAWSGLSHAGVVLHVSALHHELQLPPDLPAPLHSLLAACLSTDPAERPSFEAVEARLAAWLQDG